MPSDDLTEAARMAAIAGGMGGTARVLVSLQGGSRQPLLIALDFLLGGMLGIVTAGFVIWWDPSLRDIGWPVLIVGGAAGLSGALGTRLLDLVVAGLQRRMGS